MDRRLEAVNGGHVRRPAAARLLVAAGLAAATLLAASQPALAEACPGGLTVAGVPVTGSDCQDVGDGSVRIRGPRLLTGQAVNVTTVAGGEATMVLNASRTTMVPEAPAVPLRVNVGTDPVVVGELTVGTFELCDVGPASDLPDTASVAPAGAGTSPVTTDIVPAETGCRQAPSIRVSAAAIAAQLQLVGLDLDVLKNRALVLGLDDVRGGRVFGTLAVKLPSSIVGENTVRVGVGGEVSRNEGLRPTSISAQLSDVRIPTPIPGVFLRQAAVQLDPLDRRFSAEADVLIAPIRWLITGNVAIQDGRLQTLATSLAFSPRVPLTTTIGIDQFGFRFEGSRQLRSPGGGFITVPARLSGTVAFVAGPPGFADAGASPEVLAKVLRGSVTATIGGSALLLDGDVFAFGSAIKLGSARLLLATAPFRFEASASVEAFRSSEEAGVSGIQFLRGNAFLGIAANGDFTALGQVQVKVPENVPLVGGNTLAGSAVISNLAAAGVVTVDVGRFGPFTGGAAFVFKERRFRLINSLAPFITVTPTVSAAAGPRAVSSAALQSLRMPRGVKEAIVAVTGTLRAPRSVRFRSPRGRAAAVKLPFRTARTSYYVLRRPAPGRWGVSASGAVARLTISRIRPTPYLDPRPGYGSRPRPPVIAGIPARVCWRAKNAPRGTVVDLFEDQNGELGTGRPVATGLRRNGCFDVPTAGLEPGKHWVYGQLRQREVSLSARYWPIPIEVLDRGLLPGPSPVSAEATDDGATVSFPAHPLAAGYRVIAEPIDADVPPVEAAVAVDPNPRASLSLRGAARWAITAQAFDVDGRLGNPSGPVEVSPLSPVIADGKPNAVAQVGKPWAFQLRLGPGVTTELVSGPRRLRLSRTGLARWTPPRSPSTSAPQPFGIRACRGDRCLEREFFVSAYRPGIAPGGPARGFEVVPGVLRGRAGETVRLYAQGIDERVTVTIAGRRVRTIKRLNASAVEIRLPRLRRGAHDVELRIGRDATEVRRGAIVVL